MIVSAVSISVRPSVVAGRLMLGQMSDWPQIWCRAFLSITRSYLGSDWWNDVSGVVVSKWAGFVERIMRLLYFGPNDVAMAWNSMQSLIVVFWDHMSILFWETCSPAPSSPEGLVWPWEERSYAKWCWNGLELDVYTPPRYIGGSWAVYVILRRSDSWSSCSLCSKKNYSI